MPPIAFKNITFAYQEAKLFDNCSLKLYPNTLHFLTGKSGIGKTTLLHLLSKHLTCPNIQSNNDFWNTHNAYELAYQLISFEHTEYGYLHQLKSQQNINEIIKSFHNSEIVEELIELFGFKKLLNKYPSQLSGGQKRMLSIILALAKDLPIVFLDEPTSSLDNTTKKKFLEYLKDYAKKGHIVLCATNDSENLSYSNHHIRIDNRTIVQEEKKQPTSFTIKPKEIKPPFRLKTFLYHKKWHYLVYVLAITCIAVFLSKNIVTATNINYFKDLVYDTYLEQDDTLAYVFYEVDSTENYYPFAQTLNQDIPTKIEENNSIQKVYPYYVFPIEDIFTGVYSDNTNYKDYYFYTDTISKIDDVSEAYVEFYYPEQLEGNKVYASEHFIQTYGNGIEDFKNLNIDIAVPIRYDVSDVMMGYIDEDGNQHYKPIDSIKPIYKINQYQFHVDDTINFRGQFYNSNTPLLYLPYERITDFINPSELLPNVLTIILKDNADLKDIRNSLAKIDHKLVLYYPAEQKQSFLENYHDQKLSVYLNLGLNIVTYATLLATILMIVETFNKKDYSYFKYSGISQKTYIKYRLKSFLIFISPTILPLAYFTHYFGRVDYLNSAFRDGYMLICYLALVLLTIVLLYIFLSVYYHLKEKHDAN